jgi:hypothetical protein
MNKPPPGYAETADVYLTATQWRELITKHKPAGRNPATHRMLESGHCKLSVDGVTYAGPAVGPAPNGPTHTSTMRVDSITENGDTKWIH